MTEARGSVIMPAMPIVDAKDMRVYQKAIALLPDVYALTAQIPEREFRDQL